MQQCRTDETKAALAVELGTELNSVLCGDLDFLFCNLGTFFVTRFFVRALEELLPNVQSKNLKN